MTGVVGGHVEDVVEDDQGPQVKDAGKRRRRRASSDPNGPAERGQPWPPNPKHEL